MSELGHQLLKNLLASGEKSAAGQRTRAPALTASALKPYLDSRILREREAFEALLQAAADHGAISLTREQGYADGQILRVNLADLEALASFLNVPTQASIIERAKAELGKHADTFPVIGALFAAWQSLKRVRGNGPEDIQAWLDAIRVIQHMRARLETQNADLPVREVSAPLFNDSKRIERLIPQLDVLLSGATDSPPRDSAEVLAEIGLGREERPALLAGRVIVRRQRVSALIDAPYAGFPAATVLGVDDHPPKMILTIENLTSFHSEARQRSEEQLLMLYTAGMPSPAWRAMYARLIESAPEAQLCHWGDVDEGGFRIAANLAEVARSYGRHLLPHRMSPQDVPIAVRRPASESTLERMRHFAIKAGWQDLGEEIRLAGFTAEQEAL